MARKPDQSFSGSLENEYEVAVSIGETKEDEPKLSKPEEFIAAATVSRTTLGDPKKASLLMGTVAHLAAWQWAHS